MEPIYVGDWFPSTAFYKKVIAKYEKLWKESEFYQEHLGGDLLHCLANILTIKITFAFAD